jgi:hypothetical protein
MSMNSSQHDEKDDPIAGDDLLVGEPKIRAYLIELGMSPTVSVYHLRRVGAWPIGATGKKGGWLVASKRLLADHLHKIARGPAAAE